jgi:prepilin-type N-terminal cleavage/methylation domain-containing protein
MRPPSRPRSSSQAFTLAEVAVTIAIVGLILVFVLQGINEAKMLAAHTRNRRLARELALQTIGQIESSMFKDEIRDDRIEGTYADEGYADFAFEAVIGDKNFRSRNESGGFDNWNTEADQKKKEDQDEDQEQPYEKVQIKVTFPGTSEDISKNELVLEKWLPWKQVHPDDDKSGKSSSSTSKSSGSSKGGGT